MKEEKRNGSGRIKKSRGWREKLNKIDEDQGRKWRKNKDKQIKNWRMRGKKEAGLLQW